MGTTPFVHLHTHSYYSLLDGLTSPERLVEQAKALGMSALALTDHGGMYGIVEFYQAAKKADIHPILGCEVYVAPRSRFDREPRVDQRPYHLVLLAENNTGYQNLIHLCTQASLEGFYYKPRVDRELLSQYAEGLIACSACVMGEIPRAITERDRACAAKVIREYVALFGEDHVYLELQHHPDIKEQARVNQELIHLSREMGVPLIATNDIHYIRPDDAVAQDILMCIQTQNTLDQEDRLSMLSGDYSMLSPDQIAELFAEAPEVMENTVRIAERCEVILNLGETIFPHFDTPEDLSPRAYLQALCEEGMVERYGLIRDSAAGASEEGWKVKAGATPLDLPKSLQEIGQRLEYELSVIEQTGFETYLLIVWDFIQYAKEHRIVVGPGRGSATGSLVAYVLGITDIEPMRYDLLFERFLTPDRIEDPDIDTDFDDEHRDEVIEYVTQKYGRSNVAQVITFGTMAAKAAVRDVGRVMGMSYEEVDRVAKLIPVRPGVKLAEVLEGNVEFRQMYEQEDKVKQLVDMALKLEGVVRHASVHPCAVIMAKEPLTHYTPLQNAPRGDQVIITQYGADSLKALGLLKMDFLSLRNLTVIRRCVALVQEIHGIEVDIYHPPLDDPETYALFARGDTTAVFQFESPGMKKYLRELRPANFEDIMAMVALYRPGPMQFIDDFIARHHGRQEVRYDHPLMEDILKPTYGITVYQEEVMQVAQEMAGFTGSEADTLRKAISKKNAALMAEMGAKFREGAQHNGVPAKIADKIWTDWEEFGRYAFNKSHAAAYAFVAYQTAYLKAHYPKEFMAASLTSIMENSDRVAVLIEECRRMGIRILPPDVNESEVYFTVVEEGIRFGLGAVKNVGAGAIECIIRAREQDGPFMDLFDFCERVDLKMLNKRMIESLILAGSMDSLRGHRAQLMAMVDDAVARAQTIQLDRQRGQTSLFDLMGTHPSPIMAHKRFPEVASWPRTKMLTKEKDMLGFYVSGHPLEEYTDDLRAFTSQVDRSTGLRDGMDVTVGGIITSVRSVVDRKGKPMAFVALEDFEGPIEAVVFSDVFEKFRAYLDVDNMVMIRGKLSANGGDMVKVRAEEFLPLASVREKYARAVHIALSAADLEKDTLHALRELVSQYEGPCRLLIHVDTPTYGHVLVRSKELTVSSCNDFLSKLREVVGAERVWLA